MSGLGAVIVSGQMDALTLLTNRNRGFVDI
jgi:hypothetical protein